MEKIDFGGFALRALFALVLVMVTYNPSGYSYVGWVASVFPKIGPLMALSGVALAIGWIIFMRATLRSIGLLGMCLCAGLAACIIWLFVDRGWLDIHNLPVMSWIILVVVALILGLGMSWSLVRRRISGQVDMDDVDNG